ncbi:Short-chain dehydrogenase/reductase ATR9 [Lachnellula suecica]|uniref:Short-chain dehydrogenase/reductase ATR9 n=1 Tax=Lachnellula suecica TaxID=602035 RepID=A0A8T9C659_9HELO|nr:Short-chain dehydrogenase/reductase ATR9 [Lachnellula suecica]
MPSIRGHNLLIIGGSAGIGAAVAKLAAAEGVNVAIASSNPDRVATTIKILKETLLNANITGYVCDVSQADTEQQLEKLLTDVTAALGAPLDHIAYTASFLEFKPVSAVTMEWITQTSGHLPFNVPALLGKVAPRFLRRAPTSSLVFTGGRITDKPIPGLAILAGWATALTGFARSLAVEVAPIRVNLVSPGSTDTDHHGPPEVRGPKMAAVAKASLLGKVGKAEEVAEAYIYLMKDSNCTGARLAQRAAWQVIFGCTPTSDWPDCLSFFNHGLSFKGAYTFLSITMSIKPTHALFEINCRCLKICK